MDYDIINKIALRFQACKDVSLIDKLLSSKAKFDLRMPFLTRSAVSEEFLGACRKRLSQDKSIPDSALRLVAEAAREESKGAWPEFELTDVQKEALNRAVAFLGDIGIDVDYDIKTVKGLGDGCLGLAYDNTIYLSILPFEAGVKQIASTLLEEYVHLKYGCEDFDRQMQNWLFDKILTIGEEMVGEPI